VAGDPAVTPAAPSARRAANRHLALPHAIEPAHGHMASGPVHRVPRLGETSVQVVVLASQAPATAMPPPATSLNASPASMQNPPLQEMLSAAAGAPGGSTAPRTEVRDGATEGRPGALAGLSAAAP
jgi:hypothetical protein